MRRDVPCKDLHLPTLMNFMGIPCISRQPGSRKEPTLERWPASLFDYDSWCETLTYSPTDLSRRSRHPLQIRRRKREQLEYIVTNPAILVRDMLGGDWPEDN